MPQNYAINSPQQLGRFLFLAKLSSLPQRYIMKHRPTTPIFGICLGNQILALAAGANTYKMKCLGRGKMTIELGWAGL